MGRDPSVLSGWGSARKKVMISAIQGCPLDLWLLAFDRFSTAGSLVAINGSERAWQKAWQVHGQRAAHAGPA